MTFGDGILNYYSKNVSIINLNANYLINYSFETCSISIAIELTCKNV
jgi:hypothetical protein